MSVRGIISVVLGLVLLAGCSQWPSYSDARKNKFIPTNHKAAEELLAQLDGKLGGSTLLIATLANIDALDRSSTLGRLVSEQVSARFTQADYRMVEMKFGNSIYVMRNQGEMMLTREVQELAAQHAAQAVIVGTYGQSKEFIYVNLKIIQPGNNVVLAVHDYALPIDENTQAMLRSRR